MHGAGRRCTVTYAPTKIQYADTAGYHHVPHRSLHDGTGGDTEPPKWTVLAFVLATIALAGAIAGALGVL